VKNVACKEGKREERKEEGEGVRKEGKKEGSTGEGSK
jgi:hypothetical protein